MIEIPEEYKESLANYCKNDEQSKALLDAFSIATEIYGYQYVNAINGRARVRNSVITALKKSEEYFLLIGSDTIANAIHHEINNLASPTKSGVLSDFRKELIEYNNYAIPQVYTRKEFDHISNDIQKLFIDYCEAHAPSEPPEWLDPLWEGHDAREYV